MINRLMIGEYYNIRGAANWNSYLQDIQVMSTTKMSQIEALDIQIYDTWFKPFNVPESVYSEILDVNNYVYQCRKLISRDPKTIESGSEIVYLFPQMIDYEESSHLLVCKAFLWELRTKPYKDGDLLSPLASAIPMKELVTNSLKGYIYDGIVTTREEIPIIVSETEYTAIDLSRQSQKLDYETDITSKHNAMAEHEAYLYNQQAVIADEREKIRLLRLEADRYINHAVKLYNENASLNHQLIVKDNHLKAIHTALVDINNSLPSADQITIPEYEDL